MIYMILFVTFLKIGAFTFGGGYAMLPLVQDEVLKNGWMAMKELINFIAISESTPGPFAVNISTYVGMHTSNIFGAMIATLGVVLPSFIIILIVAHYFKQFKDSQIVKSLLSGLKPAVIGLIASSIISLGSAIFTVDMNIAAIFIFGVMLLLIYKKVHPIYIIIISALLGIIVNIV